VHFGEGIARSLTDAEMQVLEELSFKKDLSKKGFRDCSISAQYFPISGGDG
jgi:hypothetical protein